MPWREQRLMDRTLHDMRNDLAVAIGTVHALIDGKLPADTERLSTILSALESLDARMRDRRTAWAAVPGAENEPLLSAVIEGSPYAKVLVGNGGRIVLVNAQAELLFGYTRAEFFELSIEMLVPERFRRGHAGLRDHFNASPEARPMGAGRDLFGRRKDATEFPIEIGLNPVTTGGETFTLAAISDITERKRGEALRVEHALVQRHATELEELNRELANASRFKTEFVATMSHELRTPLSAIIGAAELLGTAELDARARLTVQTISEAAEALFGLINSVLDFSKIEAGKMDLDLSTLTISSVVERAVDVVAQLAREKGVTLEAIVEPDLPLVYGDRDRLRQIVLNLLANAVKFTDAGRITVRAVAIERTDTLAVVRFEVRDSGIGIAADVIPQLFEPFAQADRSPSRKFGGTGLGLSISKRLVALMGGAIGVESTPGAGSTFWFVVPFACAAVAPPAHAVPAAAPIATNTILVAEDNVPLQRLLKLQFDELGQNVTFVADGKAALDAVARERFAMIFMDCQMPELDGLEATKRIRDTERARGGHVPIAAMTANAFAEDRAACLAAGMDDYLPKPVRLADLRSMIERWTQQ